MRRTLVLPLVAAAAAMLAAGFYVTLAGSGHPDGEAVSTQGDGGRLGQSHIDALVSQRNDPQKPVKAVAETASEPKEPAPAVAQTVSPKPEKPSAAVADTSADPEKDGKHGAFGDKNCPHKSDEAAAGVWKDPDASAGKWAGHDGDASAWAAKWQGDWGHHSYYGRR
jgi:hypothetical protein